MDEEAESFYRRFGFICSPVCERQHLLLLKDARKFVQAKPGDVSNQ